MTCKLCLNYGTCSACRAATPRPAGRDVVQALALLLAGYLLVLGVLV